MGHGRMRGVVAALLASLLLVAAGCSGSSSGGGGAAKKIKLGAVLNKTGPYAELGNEFIKGFNLAIDEFAGKGGVFAQGIELIWEDEGNDPATTIKAYEKLIESDRVNLIIGPISTANGTAVRDIPHKNKTLAITAQASGHELTGKSCSPYWFRVGPSMEMQSRELGVWVGKNLGKKVYLFSADYQAGKDFNMYFKRGLEASGGTVVKEAFAPLNAQDAGPYMADIIATKPDVVAGFFAGSLAVKVVKAFHDSKIKDFAKIAYVNQLVSLDVINAHEGRAEGIYNWGDWTETSTEPNAQAFVQKFKAKYNAEPSRYAVVGYEEAKSAFLAMEKAGSADPDKVRVELAKLKWDGPSTPIEFKPNHQASRTGYIMQVKNGKNQILAKVPNVLGTEGPECKM